MSHGPAAPSRTRRLYRPLAPVAALALAVLAGLVLYENAGPGDWGRAGRFVAAQAGPADVVLLASCEREDWADHFAPAAVLCGPNLPRPEDFAAVWLVQEAARPEPAANAFAARFADRVEWRFGRLWVARLAQPRARVFDLATRFAGAHVTRVQGDTVVEDCRGRRGAHFDCPGDEWRDVGPQEGRFDGHHVRGIWMHPIQGLVTRIDLDPAVLGARLVVLAGLSDEARGKRTPILHGPVGFRVLLDGRPLLTRWLWPADALTVTAVDLPGAAAVPHALRLETIAWNDYFANLHVALEGLR